MKRPTREDGAGATWRYADLVRRLRGIYTVAVADGAGPLHGSNSFTRRFTGLPPIHGEAAAALEELGAILAAVDREAADLPDWLRELVHEVLEESKPS